MSLKNVKKPPLRHLPQVAALDVLASDPSASSEGRSLLHQAAGAGHVEAMGDGKGSPNVCLIGASTLW